jgi:predicted O-linked N-acetylglucosamine transferase (SPINDLY family)
MQASQIAKINGLVTLLRANPNSKQGWRALFWSCYLSDDLHTALSHALALIPRIMSPGDALLPIGQFLLRHGFHDAAVTLFEAIVKEEPDARLTHSDLIVHKQLYGCDDDAAREYRRWNERFVAPLARLSEAAKTSQELGRPLRIGFVSNDFAGNHSLNAVMAPWFMFKEKRSDSYIFYSNFRHNTPFHQLFLEAADVIADVDDLTDEQFADKVRQDRIDILVDLVSHGARNRLLTYARKPAPIIVTWAGLGMSTGAETIDYLIADKILVPPASVGFYREKIAYLPHVSMAWCPPRSAPSVEPASPRHQKGVVFGNLTRVVKFQNETIELWASVLHRVPNAKMLLKDQRLIGQSAKRILSMFSQYGIGGERLILREGTDQAQHLAAYSDVDIVLDSIPQNGGISSLEALWMGVPVVTYRHPTKLSARVGLCIMEKIGLPALVADTEEGYVALAEFLAANPEQRVALRHSLRQRVRMSPLCDVESFQRGIAAAFHVMWGRYCSNQPPETFSVDSV